MAKSKVSVIIAEVTKISLEPGDVLSVSVKTEEYYKPFMDLLTKGLREAFPNNQVFVVSMPPDNAIEFTAIKPQKKVDCSDEMSYCTDCSCGKKETIEGSKEGE